MNDDQWRAAWEIFRTASELEADQRRSFLASVHADPEILEEVTAMLAEGAEESPGALPSRVGARFGRFEITSQLGSGGMGEVYAAHDSELDRMVAIKFLTPEMAASQPAVDRLVREAKAASALNHPHIVTVYEVIRAGGDVAIAMELVEGTVVRKFCGKPQEIPKVIQWGRHVAQALAAAHQRHIVHRDIKPENLMVREDGILKVLDFGLARQGGPELAGNATNSLGLLAGTLHYMAPEQTRADAATSASDIFSLGIVLYELSTGTHPFRTESPIDTAHAIAHAEPKRPSVLNPSIPPSLDALLLAMLAKDPSKRPTAVEVDRRLSEIDLATGAKRSRPILRAAAAVLVMSIAGISLFGLRDRIFARKEPDATQLTTQVPENRVVTAAISPDGKTLAFAALGGTVLLRRMSDGFSQPLSLPEGLRVDHIAWFPDESKLLVSGSPSGDTSEGDHPGVWAIPASGGPAAKIVSDAKGGVPSPDGTRVGITSTDESIVWVAAADGAGARQIRGGGQATSFSTLIWSPDGKRLAYQRRDTLNALDRQASVGTAFLVNNYRYSYESVEVETGRVTASAPDIVMASACGLADGRIIYLRWPSLRLLSFSQVWELRTDPASGKLLGPPRQLTRDEDSMRASISASSDGKQVVAVRSQKSIANVYVADLPPDGQVPQLIDRRRLTFSEAQEFPHAWTADSRSIIFESDRNGRYFDLYSQNIDKREAEPLVLSPTVKVMAHVTPDGKWMLYRESGDDVHWKVMRIPVGGGTPETVFTGGNPDSEFRCGLRPGARCVLRMVENDRLVFYELDPMRGKGRELARTGWSPLVVGDWDLSPDGTQVAIPNHDPRDARIRLMTLDTGPDLVVAKVLSLSGLKDLSGIVWAASGAGWYVSVHAASGGLLMYVDLQGHLTNLLATTTPTYAVPSPDGRRIAFPDWSVSSNAWLFHGL